ncbi:MAG: phosphatidate cytidylyltransferase [Lentisphaerae bacterium]|nr:phosphatidate cytidylyltransferase [Lentisphaerota bacterium]
MKYPRILSGILVSTVSLAIIFLTPVWAHLIFLFAIFFVGEFEFNSMAQRGGYRYELLITAVCGLAYLVCAILESPAYAGKSIVASWNNGISMCEIILALTPALLFISCIFKRKTQAAMESFALSLAGFWFAAVLSGFMMRIAFIWGLNQSGHVDISGKLALFLLILFVKISDIGAYVIGKNFGKRKLIPEISPKKTVEGLLGGYLFSISAGLLCWIIAIFSDGKIGAMRYGIIDALALPIVLVTAGVLGDLSASLIKRSVAVKDASKIFPGMGGMLDVLDSLLFAAPVMFVYTLIFLK